MFTGIVETLGGREVKPTRQVPPARDQPALDGHEPGDSVAVNGVCLTVVSADTAGLHMDVSRNVAGVGAPEAGHVGEFERPLGVGGRVDGHFVQGHVDATGSIEELRKDGDSWWVTVKFPPSLASQIVRKGSIAVDGISLTVAGVDDKRFDVQVIPYTWEHTNLRFVRVNDLVNLECDMLGKYVLRAMEVAKGSSK